MEVSGQVYDTADRHPGKRHPHLQPLNREWGGPHSWYERFGNGTNLFPVPDTQLLLLACCRYIHVVVCLTTGKKPLPQQVLYIVRSRASSFKWEYLLLSLRSSSNFLRLLPRLPVTSIPSFICPSITRCRRQILPILTIQLAFRLLLYVGYSSAPWL